MKQPSLPTPHRTPTGVVILTALLLPWLAGAQQPRPTAPTPPVLAPGPVVELPELDPALTPKAPAAPVKPGVPATTTTTTTTVTAPAKGGIMLNFQGASLNDVLNYLSEAAGFVVVQEVQVAGTVNVVSRQPISAEEAVDLVNAVLIEKGYIAIRNGRILKIVSRKDAQKRDLPVQTGSDPERIPRKDEMVTQILPLRFGEAAKLVENLRPLLADNATISANDSSNSILLTDTQTNIRRIAEIIRAIDTSVASISTIHVYQLQYANAKELAAVITQLFATNSTAGNNQNQRRRGGGGGGGGFGGFGGPGGGPGGGGAAADPSATSEARQANSRVIAVADDQSNSLIVSAPEDLIPNITEVVNKIDTSVTDVTSTRIFKLIHADAVETADIITTLYSDASSQPSSRNNQRGGGGQGRQGFNGGGGQGFNGGGQAAAAGAPAKATEPCSSPASSPWAMAARTRSSSMPPRTPWPRSRK